MHIQFLKGRSANRGAVAVISTLLVASAMLRLGAGSGQAIAQGLLPQAEQSSVTHRVDPKAEKGATLELVFSLDRRGLTSLVEDLKEREERVSQLERQISLRKKALDLADTEVRERITLLQKAEQKLRQTIALADGAAENDLARLTTVYETMKPKEAAALFQAMEPGFAAGFLGRMKPAAAAAILAGLPTDIAYSISVILAGRNATVPKS